MVLHRPSLHDRVMVKRAAWCTDRPVPPSPLLRRNPRRPRALLPCRRGGPENSHSSGSRQDPTTHLCSSGEGDSAAFWFAFSALSQATSAGRRGARRRFSPIMAPTSRYLHHTVLRFVRAMSAAAVTSGVWCVVVFGSGCWSSLNQISEN